MCKVRMSELSGNARCELPSSKKSLAVIKKNQLKVYSLFIYFNLGVSKVDL
jgi:hypothetical protein